MAELKVEGRAKINLSLDVLRRREDGYHEVKMIMQQVDLYDEITLKTIDSGIVLDTNCEFIPTDDKNIAYKAAKMIIDKYNIDKGIKIYIDKNIPVGAGLAGGSTDAAAVLTGLNRLWDLNIPKEELMKMGKEIGADVPFCIMGGAALAEGIGEKLTPIEGLDSWIILCKPSLSVSTQSVYRNLKVDEIQIHPNTDEILSALKENQVRTVASNLCNVLENVTIEMHPVVKDIKKKMLEYGTLGTLMSGSGPTVFGIFRDYNKAKSAYDNLKKIYKQVYLIKTYNTREEEYGL
ncbi:4-(cytidine 5'-diphospho)-2-C-methyl-D-erythritol kinase [Anaeromicrobium sediminis]|uniref:4-diphosphocytidyl-2-C-methyl-D-erythritol kinase n=1 Tax=Anaeromicrobium sediminis TaxID=1478221 RepID=A0A267MBK3_9FIRM|nr:4-(cytidine 5'-diphospho)-2-C-methyl-D-erythritol kinase [Anaeromicrobium sediminis]PAB56308.1 4-(cytidine 5'-diphospho)-2-C-methyl-D-erythritol kinase [Anaeromicrobium sediminis]